MGGEGAGARWAWACIGSLEIYSWGSKEAVGVVLWAVRVVGVVRAVTAGGAGMHWQPLNTLI